MVSDEEYQRSVMVTLIEWTALTSAAAGISATVFILIQLRHMDKHRDLEVSMKLFEWAQTENMRRAFRWVENEFQFVDFEKYKSEIVSNFDVADYPYRVEGFFEEVGFLVNKKFVDIDVIVDRLGAYIISNWKKLEPWIMVMRKERIDKAFGEHFQELYEKTVAYMKGN